MTASRLRAVLILALLVATALAPPAFSQCSMCQQVVTQSPEAQRMSAELNRAILLMFLGPYLVFLTFVLAFFRAPLGRRLKSLARAFFLPR